MLQHHCGDPTFSRHLKERHRNIRLIFRLCPLIGLISDCSSNPVLHVSFHFTYSRCTRWHFNCASNQVVREGVRSGEEGCWGAAGSVTMVSLCCQNRQGHNCWPTMLFGIWTAHCIRAQGFLTVCSFPVRNHPPLLSPLYMAIFPLFFGPFHFLV